MKSINALKCGPERNTSLKTTIRICIFKSCGPDKCRLYNDYHFKVEAWFWIEINGEPTQIPLYQSYLSDWLQAMTLNFYNLCMACAVCSVHSSGTNHVVAFIPLWLSSFCHSICTMLGISPAAISHKIKRKWKSSVLCCEHWRSSSRHKIRLSAESCSSTIAHAHIHSL